MILHGLYLDIDLYNAKIPHTNQMSFDIAQKFAYSFLNHREILNESVIAFIDLSGNIAAQLPNC